MAEEIPPYKRIVLVYGLALDDVSFRKIVIVKSMSYNSLSNTEWFKVIGGVMNCLS